MGLGHNNDFVLTMTLQTKTWGGLLYPPNGSKRSMTDTFQTLTLTNTLTTCTLKLLLIHKPNYLLTKLCTQFTAYLNTDPYKSQKTITWQHYKGQHTSKRSPAWNFYPTLHKLEQVASSSNLNKLTGRPIITAYSWINPIHCDFLALNWKTSFLYKKLFFKNETWHSL